MSRIDRLICHVLPNAFLMALVADGRLAELQIVRRDKPTRVESVFLGRLERVMPELDAAFVDIGIGRSGFLRAEERAGVDDWPPPGAPLLVQVRNDAEGEKGPRVSMNVAVTGRYLVYHPVGSGVGRAIPFMLCALLLQRAMGPRRGFTRHHKAISLVSGVILIAFGVLLATGTLPRITTELTRWLDELGLGWFSTL
mgnify:CR=1 FL=1